jgi:hypothetical protein
MIKVTSSNVVELEGGRIGIGEQDFSCRAGSYKTYQVRLSQSAAKYLEEGDIIEVWDGRSELPYVECGGQIIKSSGERIQLKGSRYVGIDTGHPPHLGLKMIQSPQLTWETLESITLLKHEETKFVFVKKGLCPALGDLTLEEAQNSFQVWEGYKDHFTLNRNERCEVKYNDTTYYGWTQGYVWKQKKVVRLSDTNVVEIFNS